MNTILNIKEKMVTILTLRCNKDGKKTTIDVCKKRFKKLRCLFECNKCAIPQLRSWKQ